MGAWNNSSYNNWVVTSSTTSSGAYSITSGSGVYPAFSGNFTSGVKISQPISIPEIERIATSIRKEIEEFCKKSDHFAGNLAGICGIASRLLFKELRNQYSYGMGSHTAFKFGYVATPSYRHIFLYLPKNDDFFQAKQDLIIDVCADIYGEDPVCVLEAEKIDINEKPWWDTTTFYTSESGLMARQRKDKWPRYQISINAAKSKKQQVEIITQGQSDISKGKLKVAPLDDKAEKHLHKLAKGNLLQLNLAKLMLDPDPEVVKMANKIAKIVTSR